MTCGGHPRNKTPTNSTTATSATFSVGNEDCRVDEQGLALLKLCACAANVYAGSFPELFLVLFFLVTSLVPSVQTFNVVSTSSCLCGEN